MSIEYREYISKDTIQETIEQEVTITQDMLPDTVATKDLIVTITALKNGTAVADKTYGEIVTALDSGRSVCANIDGIVLSLRRKTDFELQFTGSVANAFNLAMAGISDVYCVEISSNNAVTVGTQRMMGFDEIKHQISQVDIRDPNDPYKIDTRFLPEGVPYYTPRFKSVIDEQMTLQNGESYNFGHFAEWKQVNGVDFAYSGYEYALRNLSFIYDDMGTVDGYVAGHVGNWHLYDSSVEDTGEDYLLLFDYWTVRVFSRNESSPTVYEITLRHNELHKIEKELLPGDVASSPDWEDSDPDSHSFIRNKPFGDMTTGGNEIEWDGNRDAYYYCADIAAWQISPESPTYEELELGFAAVINKGGSQEWVYSDSVRITNSHPMVLLNFGGVFAYCIVEDWALGDDIVVPKGTYFYFSTVDDVECYVEKLMVNNFWGYPYTKKIEERFLPDSITAPVTWGDIQNKPFGEEYVEVVTDIIPEGTYDSVKYENDLYEVVVPYFCITHEYNINVEFDGSIYQLFYRGCLDPYGSEKTLLYGNAYLFDNSLEDTGEPFVLMDSTFSEPSYGDIIDIYKFFTNSTESNHTIRVFSSEWQNVVTPIEDRFIPDSIATKEYADSVNNCAKFSVGTDGDGNTVVWCNSDVERVSSADSAILTLDSTGTRYTMSRKYWDFDMWHYVFIDEAGNTHIVKIPDYDSYSLSYEYIQASSTSVSWNDLTDKPFYDETPVLYQGYPEYSWGYARLPFVLRGGVSYTVGIVYPDAGTESTFFWGEPVEEDGMYTLSKNYSDEYYEDDTAFRLEYNEGDSHSYFYPDGSIFSEGWADVYTSKVMVKICYSNAEDAGTVTLDERFLPNSVATKEYVNEEIANLINGAPTTLDTLGEIATAMAENAGVVEALEAAIGNKVNSADLTSHTSNKSNPHDVTLSQLGVTATAAELNIMDGVTATTSEINFVDGVTSNIQTQLNAKVPTSRTVNGKALSSNISLTAADVGATSFQTATISIATSAWSSKSATVNCSIATASNTLIIAPAPSSHSAWGTGKVRATAQAAGKITFACDTVPTAAVSVNVVALG